MELEASNNKIKHGHVYIIQIMDMIYIGLGENSKNKNRFETHLYELFYKVLKRRTSNKEIA